MSREVLLVSNPPTPAELETLQRWLDQPINEGQTPVLVVMPEDWPTGGDGLVVRHAIEDDFACLEVDERYRVRFDWMSQSELDALPEFDGF